ncbi:hypothetical protein [Bradyrhizobium genosp. P]|uniref:hypothetical protein n=1 Tax=Bradyrhizobium genosp. P TaxID=83641 RepID=UPI003CF0533B
MIIDRLLRDRPFEPKISSRIMTAYEQALHTLCVKDRDDPLTEMIAKTIIKVAQTGVEDPAEISAQAIKEPEVR